MDILAPISFKVSIPECIAVAAMQLRMRMRILTGPEKFNSLAYSSHQISNKKLRIMRCEGIRQRMRIVLQMQLRIFRPHCRHALRMEVCDKIR